MASGLDAADSTASSDGTISEIPTDCGTAAVRSVERCECVLTACGAGGIFSAETSEGCPLGEEVDMNAMLRVKTQLNSI